FEVPSGWFADRFGARITLARIVIWWSVLTSLTGAVTGLASLLVVRFLFGVGEAGMFPASARAFGSWLPERQRGRALRLTLMPAALAGAVTQRVVVAMVARTSWRAAFGIFGSLGVFWAIGWWRWFRDDPGDHPAVNASELRLIVTSRGALPGHDSVPWGSVLRNPTVRALCFMYGAAIYGWYFYLTWLPTYLVRARGFDLAHAGWLAALPLGSFGAGVVLGVWVIARLDHGFG